MIALLKFWKWMNGLYGWIMIFIFGFVILIGAWQMYDNYYMFNHTLDKSILKYKPDPLNPKSQECSLITDEMVAWITIDGTCIDYPIMQSKNNSYFLNTDPFGVYSLSGSIFLDSRCSSDFTDEYSVVYGHHMDYGKMFGALDDFLNEQYFKSHTKGTLMVGRNAEKVYSLDVFACMRVDVREKIVFDIQSNGIQQFIHDNAVILTDERDSRILALSTCTDADLVTRVVVFCYINE